MKNFIVFFLLVCSNCFAGNYLDDNLKKLNWNGIDVVWLEDDSYPTYYVSVYFHAGALSDKKGKYGETELMFNQLTSGTTRYATRQEIVDKLEFFGASYGANVTHEYSTYTVSGLAKDMLPITKMVCHAFKNASYPVSEFKKTKKRIINGLQNLVTNHSALANRIFREVSLGATAYKNPVSGTMKSIKKITAKDLHDKLIFFNEKVKKRIYIKGPKSVMALKNVFEKDCGWKGTDYVQKNEVVKRIPSINNTVYLVPVPKANQAQIRVGRFLTQQESNANHEIKSLASKYLGGGFTSRLMQELRVKRGLTYSAGAYASSQQTYGRSGISTFTKNETISETLKYIKEIIESEKKEVSDKNFNHIKRFIKGNYLFGLESTKAFLETLLFFDHAGRDYEDIYQFPKRIDNITKEQLMKMIGQLYNWDNQTKLVLGNKSLKKALEKSGYQVIILNYKSYL